MKTLKKTLLLLCSLLALVLSLAIAACGSKRPTLTFKTGGGTEIPPIEADAGTDITDLLPDDPVRDGYIFEGWYLKADFSGEAQTLPTVMPEKSVTYYAKWTEASAVSARLTLTTNDGGLLEKSAYDVPVGTNLLEFLADKEPTPISGLTFAGWYRGSNKVSASEVMSAAGITLTAKYNASYTVEVYRQQADESYVKDETDFTGTAFYGEPFSFDNFEKDDIVIEDGEVTAPDYFDFGSRGRTETDRLGVNETFSIYLDRKTFYVFYNANIPEGAQIVTDTMSTGSYVYGSQTTLDKCGYVLSGHYRFLGWSKTFADVRREDLLAPGTPLGENMNITLYAIWEEGYADVFHGSDVIYPDTFDPDTKVHLEREGMDLKEGTRTGNAFEFKLDEAGSVTLTGQLLPASKYFFYYRDEYVGKYNDMDGTDATLEMKTGGVVEYRPNGAGSDADMQTGKYTINDDGYFVFQDDKDPEENFLYNLYTYADGSENVVFRKQSEEELGYYYDAESEVILYLDGLGGLRYYYQRNNAEYTGFDGNPTHIAIGYYERQQNDSDGEIFVAQTRDVISILKQFTFKNLEGSSSPSVTKTEFPDLPKDATIKGTVKLDDTVRGNYSSKWEPSADRLYLDGYGKATYGEKEGTYTLFTWLRSVEEENGETIEQYYLVRFDPNDSDDIIYFRMDVPYGEYVIDRTVTAAANAAYTDAVGRFDFDNDLFVLNITFRYAFVIIFENGDAEVWTAIGETTQHKFVYCLYTELNRKVEKKGDLYDFAPNDDGADYNKFMFSIDGNKAHVELPDEHEIVEVETGVNGQTLHLDYTARLAYLGDTYSEANAVNYQYTIGYIDLYTFTLKDGTQLYYWTQANTHGGFTRIGARSMYLIRITPELEETSYIGLLFFVDGSPEGETYLAYQLESGMYRMVGVGTTVAKNGDYEFTLSRRLPDMENSDFNGYNNFIFRIYEVQDSFIGMYIPHHDDLSFDNFVADGYGNYTYTDDAGNSHKGVISDTIGMNNGRIIYFDEGDDGDYDFIFKVDGKRVTDVTSSPDVGYWYEMGSNQNISEYHYIVLDGMGNVYYYEYDYMYDITELKKEGTYEPTPNYHLDPYGDTQYDFLEYYVTFEGEDRATYYVSVQPSYDAAGNPQGMMPLYQVQIPHRVGEFRLRGEGTITSQGYPGILATYVDMFGETYFGNMYIGTVHTGTSDHGFVNSVAGGQVHFWALYRLRGGASVPTAENLVAISEDFFFKIEGDELVPLSLPYGDYAMFADGFLDSSKVLRLDGISAATVRSNSDVMYTGSYESLGSDEYLFVSESNDFRFTFRLSSKTIDGETVYIFEQHNDENDYVLFREEDWTTLVLNGYGDAHYINRYGDVIIGTYTMFDKQHKIGAFESDSFSDVFVIGESNTYSFKNQAQYAAAYYAENFSSVVVTGSRFIIEGTEYFYTVAGSTVTLYAVSGFAQTTTTLPSEATYTYGVKQYTKYTEGTTLTFTNDDYKSPITLKFTPDGADFAVAAEFAGIRQGYRVVVSYELVAQEKEAPKLTLKTMLTYLASGIDTRVEEYALTLHYTGESNTFTVEPHEHGVFKRYESVKAEESMEGNDSVNIASGHIGVVNLEPKEGEGLTITLDSTDSLGAPLGYKGPLDAIRTEAESDAGTLGNVRAITLQGSDDRDYVLRFWLNTDKNGVQRFIMHSIVVEKVIDIDEVGEVTFAQLWEGGSYYTGKKKDIVEVSVAQSVTDQILFHGAIDENTVALARQHFDYATEETRYEAFVFTIQKDDGFITNATKTGDYNYGEVTTSDVRYTLRFLYTGTAADFEVAYILTFSQEKYLDATFVKDESDPSKKNVWTITTPTATYTATITAVKGAGLTLEIKTGA